METNQKLNDEDELEDFTLMLDQVQVNLDVGREEIRPCRCFPKGAVILAKQNEHVTFALKLGKIKIEFASEQMDKDEAQARAVGYARNFERGIIPIDVLNCLVR